MPIVAEQKNGLRLTCVVLAWSVTALAFIIGIAMLSSWIPKTPEKWASLESGMSKEQVKELFGEPAKECEKRRDESAVHCQVKGYQASFCVGAQTGFGYAAGRSVIYVYFDEHGRVLAWKKKYKGS